MIQTNKQTKLELLNKIHEKLADQLNLNDTLKALDEIIKEKLKCPYAEFAIVDEKKNKHNIYTIKKNGEIKIEYVDPSGITNKTIKTKKTIAAEDVTKVSYYSERSKGIKSELCTPIFYKRKTVGCINLEFEKQQNFNKDTITILEIIGRAIGSAIITAKLLEELETFRTLIEHMNEGAWMGDEDHNTIYVNKRFAELTGLSQEECLKKDCFAFYGEESIEKIHENHKLREKGISSQYELTMTNQKTGEKIPLLCSGANIPEGTVGIFTDLRSIKETEKQIKELAKSDKLLAYISDNSIDAIVNLDRNLVIKTWNKGATKMFGYEKEETVGQNIRMLLPPEKLQQGELEQLVKRTLEKGFLKNFETTRVKKDGKVVNIALSVTKLTDEKNRFIGFGVIYRDITYQKKSETELQSRFESMQHAYMELGTQRRQLDYLLETLNIAIGDEQFPNIENYVVNAAIMLTKSNAATLRIYNPKDGHLHLKAASGVQPEWWGKSKIPFKNSVAERAYKSRQPLFINEIQNNTSYTSPKLAAEHNFVASLLIPLYVKSDYIGNLSLYSSNRNKLHLIDNSFIANFGKQASLALFTNTLNK